MTEDDLMRLAVETARRGIAAGQMPFGAVIVRDGMVVAATHNTICCDVDPTAHAEVNCIREAAQALKTIDLRGCMMFSSCEPCPMCLSAILWSKIDRVVYGATNADAAAAGFGELDIPAGRMAEMARSPLKVEGGLLREECAALFLEWSEAGLSQTH
jgi:guanine deaminase